MTNNLQKSVLNATKWSSITELSAKIINPVTQMILARLLAPEAFGVLATVTMIMSFADMFTDAGFQKYLVQREFKDEKEKYNNANVAFWTNFSISIVLWLIIILFSEEIAAMVGNPGLGIVISVSSIKILLTSFSSIQMALYRRDFDFKTLFVVKIVGISIPFLVTIPLALLGFSYWSLVIGLICTQLTNAVILTVKSKWKPKIFYSFSILKEMFSFSAWTLMATISTWFTKWIDAFLIATALSQYYLGLYKTSTALTTSILSIVTATVAPVLYSALSRVQNVESSFKAMFYKVQKAVAYLIFPMGVGVYLYRELVNSIILGEKWSEASDIIGIWALTSAIMIIFSSFNAEVYRAKGKPKLSFLGQILHLSFLIPTCLISMRYGFWPLVYARSLIRLQGVIVGFIIMKYAMGFPILDTIKNNVKPMLCTSIMIVSILVLKSLSDSVIWSFLSILISISIYLTTVFVIANDDYTDLKKLLKKT